MNVAKLISILQKYPQDLPVAYRLYSEHCLMEEDDIYTEQLSIARADGWVHSKRADVEDVTYLIFPGH